MIIDAEMISDCLGVPHVGDIKAPLQIAEVKPETENVLESDTAYARSNLYSVIEMGKTALAASLSIADQSENPRAFEVFGGLMKQLAEVNQQLVEMEIKKMGVSAKANGPSGGGAGTQTVNNTAVFVGSTADLAKLIKGGSA